jgi:tetratricopeptide (TPR) repeat protein
VLFRSWLGDLTGAEQAYSEGIAAVRRGMPERLQDLVTLLLGRAENRILLGQVSPAEADLRTALEESSRRNGAEHIDTVHVETRLGALLHATGRREEGRRLVERAAAHLGQGGEFASPNLVGPVERNLGLARLADGRWQEARPPLTENLALKRRIGYGVLLAAALDDLAVLDTLTGHFAAAHRELDEAAQSWDKITAGKADPARGNRFLLHAGTLRLAEGDPAGATVAFARVATPRDAAAMPLDADRVAADAGRVAAALALGHADEALRLALGARERLTRAPTRAYWPALEAELLLDLGRAQTQLHDLAGAGASLERALALRVANEQPRSPWIGEAEVALGELRLAAGDRAGGARLAAQAAAIFAAHAELGPQFRAPLRRLMAALGRAPQRPAVAGRAAG